MAGNKKQAADVELLDMTTAGDEALRLLAEGELMGKICTKLGVGKLALLNWLGAPERAAAAARARASGAASLVEEAQLIADGQKPIVDPETFETINDTARDKLRVQVRHWVAERVDRQTWGQQQQAQVNINLNGLHLDALRARSSPKADVVDMQPVDN